MASQTTPLGPMTAQQYSTLPESNVPMELIEGMIVMNPTPIGAHQSAVGRLFLALQPAEQLELKLILSPMDVIVDDHTVVQPDVMLIPSKDYDPSNWVRVPPVLAVEVASPSTARHDERVKLRIYERFGVGEYWMFDHVVPSLTVLRLVDGSYQPHALVVGEQPYVSARFGVTIIPDDISPPTR